MADDLKAFAYRSHDGERAGLFVDGALYDLTWILAEWPEAGERELPDRPTLFDLLHAGVFTLSFLREAWEFASNTSLARKARLPEDVAFLPPVTRPQKIICLGRNYAAHAREGGHDVPTEPIFFAKAPSALVGHGDAVVLPTQSKRVDHEAELAVVIGRAAKQVPEAEAWDYVAGYTAMNDVTARDLQKKDIERGNPWFRSKSFDTFCPLGPWLVPREAIPDPHALKLEMRVNGQVRQSASTGEMLFKIPRLIAEISVHMTLYPGDIISTGTPQGISPVHAGDVMEVVIERIGTLRNPVKTG